MHEPSIRRIQAHPRELGHAASGGGRAVLGPAALGCTIYAATHDVGGRLPRFGSSARATELSVLVQHLSGSLVPGLVVVYLVAEAL
jgi:hypothetical protein